MKIQTINKYLEDGLLYKQVHPTLPLTILNYTDKVQWENLWDDVTLSCRGLVINDLGDIVARPFKKFFNLSEGKTNTTNEYEIFEKMDGSLGILFYYYDQWILASRGSFTSYQAVRGRKLLDGVCNYGVLNKDYTYCFEIIYKDNKIVVDYGDFEGVVLTAVFNTKSGEEYSVYGWDLLTALTFDADTPLELLSETINNNEEGYVVRFSNGDRCKVKGAEYLRLHKMMSEMSTTAVWECLRNGDSILNLIKDFPDEFYNSIREYEQKLLGQFEYEKIKIELKYELSTLFNADSDNKSYALSIADSPYKSYFFYLRNGKDITDHVWRAVKPKYARL